MWRVRRRGPESRREWMLSPMDEASDDISSRVCCRRYGPNMIVGFMLGVIRSFIEPLQFPASIIIWHLRI